MLELNFDPFRQSKKEFIESVIETCKPIFNDAYGLDFSRDNCHKVAFSTFENHAAVYEDFCTQFFPLYLAEGYERDRFYTAQAFTNVDKAKIMKAIVLLSGGIDSTACLKFYLDLSYEVECIFCDYGQPATAPELQAAKIISGIYGVPLHIITTTSLSIPSSGEICGRNALLVLQALCFMGFGTYKIILGIHAGSNYADCSSNFVVSMKSTCTGP